MRETNQQIGQVSDSGEEAVWLTVTNVMAFERISRRECYNRMRPGDNNYLHSKKRSEGDGKPGVLIYALSMSFEAQERWRKHALEAIANPKPVVDVAAECGQLNLLPRTKIDNEIAALSLPASQRDVVIQRFRIVQPLMNHDWKALGYPTKDTCRKAFAAANHISSRTILRWEAAYRESENLLDLADGLPGPERGRNTVLDASMRAFLRDCWLIKKLTVKQSHERLKCYLETKQKGCGVAHEYHIPSYLTVSRFIGSLSPLDKAARNGLDALKAARGYIDRSYDDLSSGEMWCIDEWNVDAGCYDDNDAREYYRPWIITLLDARSRFILSWCSTKKPCAENVLSLVEGAMRKFGRPDYFYSDKGGHFRGRLGRRFKEIDREKMLGPAASILEQLGVVRRGPGAEKNPRANPLERRHRIFADAARLLPTWCGPNTDQRPEGFDQQWKMHEEWISGKSPSTGLVPLTRIHAWFEQVVDDYNHKPSGANGLKGLSPAAAYQEFASDADRERRKLSEGEITVAFAEMFEQRTIQTGGIIELKDGMRYSHPSLLAIQGQKRDVKRSRNDRSYVIVLPAWKGEGPIVAARRERVGHHDPEKLSQQEELLASIKKTVTAALPPAPSLTQVMGEPPLPVRQWRRWTSAEVARQMHDAEEILTPEKPIKALDFADIENEMSEPEKILTPERLVKARDFADLEN